MKKRVILLIFSLYIINACSSPQSQNNNYIQCPEKTGEFCIQVYDPVCGEDSNTYSNSCVACQNVKRYKPGEC
ncbi:MAG: hypothetical protein AABX90_04145 [Nanoarchaeota archaeon]